MRREKAFSFRRKLEMAEKREHPKIAENFPFYIPCDERSERYVTG